MMGELRADTCERRRTSRRTVFVECGSGYRTDGPEAFRPVGETDFVVAADPDGFIAGIVGFADLTRPEVADVLAAHVEAGQGRFRGIRHASAWDASPEIRESHTKPPPDLLARDDFRRGFATLGGAGLSFDAWMYHPQLPQLVDLCRAVPDTPVVLDHLGGPLGIGPYAGRRDEVLAGWRESMRDVAACDNVVLKVGGIGMAVYGMGWHRTRRGDTGAARRGVGRADPVLHRHVRPGALHVRVELPGRRRVVHVRRPVGRVRHDRDRLQRGRTGRPVRRHRGARLPL